MYILLLSSLHCWKLKARQTPQNAYALPCKVTLRGKIAIIFIKGFLNQNCFETVKEHPFPKLLLFLAFFAWALAVGGESSAYIEDDGLSPPGAWDECLHEHPFCRKGKYAGLPGSLPSPAGAMIEGVLTIELEQKFPACVGENRGVVIMSHLLLPVADTGQAAPCLARCVSSGRSYSLQTHPCQELLPKWEQRLLAVDPRRDCCAVSGEAKKWPCILMTLLFRSILWFQLVCSDGRSVNKPLLRRRCCFPNKPQSPKGLLGFSKKDMSRFNVSNCHDLGSRTWLLIRPLENVYIYSVSITSVG